MNHPHSPPFSRGRYWRATGILVTVLALFILALVGAFAVSHLAIAQEDQDFGDAPEPTYPTTMANNGASQQILSGFSLGVDIDGEPDGQPTLNADGDDNTLRDDEDGVAFQTAMIPGLKACTLVNLTNSASVQNPMLDAWIDFNANGIWEPLEHLWGGISQPLTAGSNILCFTVPISASRGPTYARFRLSDGGNMPPEGPGNTPGEVEDYRVYIEFTKWEQPPTKKNEQDACYWGWDEISIYGDARGQNPGFPIVADDWECRDGRPVTDIHWWGSYAGWNDPEPPFTPPPTQLPSKFHIAIWTDVPKAPPDIPFSHPGELIKEWTVNRTDLNERYAGCDTYASATETCFYYDFEIPSEDWFFQTPDKDHVYWLSIAAIYPNNEPPQQYQWGWLTRKPEWNDDAVRIIDPDAPKPGDPYVLGEPIETQEEGSWDTSFILTSLPNEPKAPDLDIAIDATPTDARLSWPHVTADITSAPITVNRYYIYRDTSPYQAPSATLYNTSDGPFMPGDVIFINAGAIGGVSQNYYYYVRAAVSDRYGNDVLSAYSNSVGEFDFQLVPGTN